MREALDPRVYAELADAEGNQFSWVDTPLDQARVVEREHRYVVAEYASLAHEFLRGKREAIQSPRQNSKKLLLIWAVSKIVMRGDQSPSALFHLPCQFPVAPQSLNLNVNESWIEVVQ